MSYEYYPITGIQTARGPDGSVPSRQEINDWSSKPENSKQVNLYLLALRRLQDAPPGNRDSWFQIAGIHGMPYKQWDEPSTTQAEADNKGYCTHANFLFPPWHRPYMMLMEQQLHDIMIRDIVPKFPAAEQAAWRQAADTWRLPYWDWAVSGKVPTLAYSPQVTVTMPPGQTVRIENPLYQFKMPNNKNMGSEQVGTITEKGENGEKDLVLEYGNCYGTTRCPTEEQTQPSHPDWVEGVVNNDGVAEFFAQKIAADGKDHGAVAEMVYRLLNYELSYPQFATVAMPENPTVQSDVNIEFIHNNIHYWVGGNGGHMAQIPVATFDPLFWLHHCNIDRLWAIWQAMNPDKWFTEGGQAEFAQKIIGMKESDKVTNKTPLRPFHKDKQGAVWIPDEVRDHVRLGYTYPEIQPWREEFKTNGVLDRAKYVDSIKKVINDKYGKVRGQAIEILEEAQQNRPQPSVSGSGGRAVAIAVATATQTGSPAIAIARAFSGGGGDEAALQDAGPVPEGMKVVLGGNAIESNDFAISLRFSRFAFKGHPFSVHVYLAPADSSQPRDHARDYVGNVYNFSSPAVVNGQEVCSNCTTLQGQNVKMSAYLPINVVLNRLRNDGTLASFEKNDVSKLLERLYWRVIKYGKEVPSDQLGTLDLQILVSMNNATHYKDPSQASSFADFNVLPALGSNAQGGGAASSSSSGASGGSGGAGSGGSDPTQRPSDIQYLALDKIIKLTKEVPARGSVIVESATAELTPANISEDSTGFSFMYFDEKSGKNPRDDKNYDILLSVSVRRKDKRLRLNSKPAGGSWHSQNEVGLNNDWFKDKPVRIEVQDNGNEWKVLINGTHVGSRNKYITGKAITHVEYWIKHTDQTTSVFSYAVALSVKSPV